MKTLRLVWVVLVAGGFALWPGRAFASAVPDYKTPLEVLRSKDPKTRLGLIEQALSLGIERAFPEESLHLAMDASRALGQEEKSERYRMRLRAQLLANPKSVWTKLYQARHWDGLDAVMKRGG